MKKKLCRTINFPLGFIIFWILYGGYIDNFEKKAKAKECLKTV